MVIIQSDQFSETNSITLCGLTTSETDAPFARLLIAPSPSNGLWSPSRLMIDKIATVPRSKLGYHIGRLDGDDLRSLNSHLKAFLDFWSDVT
jgi:mRNA interferase MazF